METGTFSPARIVAKLRELQALTGDEHGAQRLAWTPTWDKARTWLYGELAELPVAVSTDFAGNIWATLPGADPRTLILGSHIDSVPGGGWLDGCLGVVAGLEVLRRFAGEGRPPVTIRLAAWAEEEGTQFGRSLFTSTLATGSFDPQELAAVTDRDGNRLVEVVGRWGVQLDQPRGPVAELIEAAAYLELHIEQGPVLESRGLPLAAVIGTMGIERHTIRFRGQAAHAGSTPMAMRQDALAAAARLALEVREIARQYGGVGTVGSITARPGIVTAVAGQCECTLDQRHLDPAALGAMLADAQAAAAAIARAERVEVEWQRLYRSEPVSFAPELVDLCAQAVEETTGTTYRMPSGPIHDAVALARAGIPSAMLFVQSLRGLSHTREEDTRAEHLLLAARAFDRLAAKTAHWIAAGSAAGNTSTNTTQPG
jgi:N-carbamoyl-L-amino-acid hydrolase